MHRVCSRHLELLALCSGGHPIPYASTVDVSYLGTARMATLESRPPAPLRGRHLYRWVPVCSWLPTRGTALCVVVVVMVIGHILLRAVRLRSRVCVACG